jgi:predicted kinase
VGTPTVIVISGPPGTGKTTLAHGLGGRLGAPALCRDELKEGMVRTLATEPSDADHHELNLRVLALFFDLLGELVRAEVTTVAEAAYQDRLWRPGLEPLLAVARIVIIRCRLADEVARARSAARQGDPRRAAHQDAGYLAGAPVTFAWPALDVPTLDLPTDPDPQTVLDAATTFVTEQERQSR